MQFLVVSPQNLRDFLKMLKIKAARFRSGELEICDDYNTTDKNYIELFAVNQEEKIINTARALNALSKEFLHSLRGVF